ncbi:MAG: DUF2550 domain-containing protein [Cellulomonadaceae bacterium]
MGELIWVVAIIAGIVLIGAGLLTSRIRTLAHRVGSFDCRIESGTTVVQGIAHYGVRELYWWRLWSLSPRPARIWNRQELQIQDAEEIEVPGKTGIYRIRCRYRGTELSLQMSLAAFAGLTSWLEAAPPAAHGITA